MSLLRYRARLISLFFFLYALPSLAASGGYAKQFLKTVTVGNPNADMTESLVYGNQQYGYFETEEISARSGKVTAQIVPPGYQFSLEIYLRKKKQDGTSYLQRSGEAQFTFPLSQKIHPMPVKQSTGLTTRFFLTFLGSINALTPVALVVNSYGEVVWAYSFSQPGGRVHLGRPLGQGRYAFLGVGGLFEIADFDGEVEGSWVFDKDEGGRYSFDHDFLYEQKSRLTTFTRRIGMAGSEECRVGQILTVDLSSQSQR